MTHIAWISDLDQLGSGYRNLTVPLCDGLTKLGQEVKVIGLQYHGQEHWYNFSVIPANDIKEAVAILQNLINLWSVDVLVIALDIPLQEVFMRFMPERKFKYIGIMPIEADPLCFSWAMVLMQMDKAYIISQFGTDEAQKVGVYHAEHIPVGIDIDEWKLPEPEDRATARHALGIEDDEFVILTVADNQERKNLSKCIEVFGEFIKTYPNSRYLLVTREYLHVGWKLRDLFNDFSVGDKMMVFERGISQEELWSLYSAADTFMLLSKTEGLGLPLLEAMACGVPCVATGVTGMKELLSDERGYLVPFEYMHIDPFGNGHRYWADGDAAAAILKEICTDRRDALERAKRAREYVEQRKWDVAVQKLNEGIIALCPPPSA